MRCGLTMNKIFWIILLLSAFIAFSQDDEIILDLDPMIGDDEIILKDEDAFNGIMPQQILFVEADYDSVLFMQGISGDVILELLISETGSIDSAWVVGSLNPILDSAALIAARQFKFSPALIFENGDTIPVAVIIQYAYHFTIEEQLTRGIIDRVNLSGRVFERGNRRPLADVPIALVFDSVAVDILTVPLEAYLETIANFGTQILEDGVLLTYTDSTGRYQFHSIPAGRFTMRIPHSGFEIFETSETILPRDSLTINPLLSPLSFHDFEIVAFYRGLETEVARHQLTLNEVRKIPGLSGDAVKVVQALPGVARPLATTGSIIVRGTSTHDSRFLLDGTDLALLYHFGGLKSTYNSEALETIEFFPGGWGAEFGDATGGVVSLTSRAPKTDRWQGHLDLSMLDMSFLVEGPITPKWSVLGTARRSHFGELLQIAMRAAEVDGITIVPYYWDYVVRADFRPNDRHHLTFSSFSSNDSLAVIFEDFSSGNDEIARQAANAITQRVFFNINGINWTTQITDNLENFATIKSEYIYESFGIMGWAGGELTVRGFRYRDNLGWQFRDNAKVNFGLDGFWGLADYDMVMPSGDGTMNRRRVKNMVAARTGIYTNFELRPIDRWLIVPGIRYDYYHELNHRGSLVPEFWDYGESVRKGVSGEPSVRLSTRFALNDEHLIKGAIGTYNQSPKPMGQAIDSLWGNPNLPTTNAVHYVLGYEWQITDLISLDLQGYINRQWNIPRPANSNDLRDAASVDDILMYYSDERGRSRGIEVMLRHNQNERFFGWIAYTLARSERRTPFTDTVSANGWVNYRFDQTHNLQILGSYKLPRRWEIGGRLRYTTGNPTTPIIRTEYDLTSNTVRPVRGVPNSDRMDPFVQFDFRAEKKWLFSKTSLTAYLDIQNLLYFIYASPEMVFYDDFYKERAVISIPIIPSLGVRFDF